MNSFFEISFETFNLFSFIIGMMFASFQSYYRRSAFKYIIAYFMFLSFYYAVIKPQIPHIKNEFQQKVINNK